MRWVPGAGVRCSSCACTRPSLCFHAAQVCSLHACCLFESMCRSCHTDPQRLNTTVGELACQARQCPVDALGLHARYFNADALLSVAQMSLVRGEGDVSKVTPILSNIQCLQPHCLRA